MRIPRTFLNRAFVHSGPPIHLIWFVTARCNLSCSHCFYHKESSSAGAELTLDEIAGALDNMSHMLSMSITGGEPFMRPDVFEILELVGTRNLAENVLLYTNGFNTDRILETVERVLKAELIRNFSVGTSIDGFEAEHDRLRGRPGAYKKTIETIKELKRLKAEFSALNIGVNTTLHKGNEEVIDDLLDHIENELGINASITLIRGDARSPALKEVDVETYRRVIERIEARRRRNGRRGLYRSIIDTRESLGNRLALRTYEKGVRTYPCYGGTLMGVIGEAGDVYPCEMLEEYCLGNLRDCGYDLSSIWRSPAAEKCRAMIRNRQCACTYECQFTCNTLYNVKFWPSYIKGIVRDLVTAEGASK